MTDPKARIDERGDFGARGGRAEGHSPGVPLETLEEAWPSTPSRTDADSGTAHKPERLERPDPGDEPLKVRFGKTE